MSTGKTYSTKYLLDSNNNRGAEGQVLSTTSTGIDWVDANTVPGTGLWLANGNDIYNSNSGNVGIGVTDPEKRLEVKSDTTYDGIMLDVLSAPEITFRDRGNSDTRVGTGRHALDGFHIDTYSGNAVLIKGSNRFVGIGTTNPLYPFSLENSGTGLISRIYNTNADGQGLLIRAGATTSGTRVFQAASSNDTKIMTVNSNGNVGIGTTGPLTKLHIAGTTDANIIRIENTSTSLSLGSTIGAIQFFNNDPTDNSPNVAASIYATAGASGGSGSLRFKTIEPGVEGDPATEAMIITNGGNVGIGETSPAVPLHISRDSASGENIALLLDNNDTTAGSEIGMLFRCMTGGGNTDFEIFGKANAVNDMDLVFESDGSNERVRFTGDGNVGIGATSPSYRLQVGVAGGLADSIRIGSYAVAKDTRQYIGYARHNTGLFESSGDGDTPSTVLAGVAGIRIVNTQGTLASSQADNSVQLLTHIYNGGSRVALHANYDGNVGIGTTSPTAKLQVAGTTTYNSDSAQALRVCDAADVSKGIHIGFDTTEDAGIIQSGDFGVSYRSLSLNPNSGNVGIGTTSPNNKLDVNGDVFINSNYTANVAAQDLTIGKTTTGNHGLTIVTGPTYTGSIYFGDSGNNDAGIIKYQHSNNSMQFVTNRSEAMRIDTSGNVGIGTTGPGAKLDVRGTGNFLGTAVSGAALVTIENNSGSTATSYGLLVKGGGNSSSGKTFEVRDDSGNTDLIVKGNGNVGINNSAPNEKLSVRGNIELVGEDVGNCGVRYIKYNCPDDASYNVLGLTTSTANFITKVGINKTSPAVKLDVSDSIAGSGFTNGLARFENTIETSSGGAGVLNIANNYQGGFGTLIKFWFEESSVATINFNSSTNAVVYNTTSDYRLKEDLKSFNGLEIVDQIKTYNYKWKKADARGYGALAHELQEVFPDAVTGEKDGEDMQGVDYSTLVPVLIKSIQELKAEIELLKQQINN